MTSRRERERTRRRRLGRADLADLIELFGLSAIAIAQPVLDVFGRAPEVFLQVDASPTDLWWFAIMVAFAPPIALAVVETIVRRAFGARVGFALHLGFIALLVGLIAIRGLRIATGIEGPSLFVLGAITATLMTIMRVRFAAVRTWLRYAAFAPVLFAAAFVFTSPARSLALGTDEAATEAVDIEPVDETVSRGPIVMVVFDELPVRSLLDADGLIDPVRYPGFAEFASEATWYRNSTGVATHTANAVPAILTGRYPPAALAAPVASDHPDNVFRLLGNIYRLNVFELDTQLCAVPRCEFDHPDNAPTIPVEMAPATETEVESSTDENGSALATLLRRARTEYRKMISLHETRALPSVQSEELIAASTTAATTTTIAAPVEIGGITPTTVERGLAKLPTVQPGRFGEWMARIDADTEDPQFSVLHLTMPHNPWNLDSDGLRYQVPEDMLHLAGTDLGHWTSDPGATISARQRHLLQTRYVDTLVTALRARLTDLGIWDSATVIITADHGAGFEAGGWLREWDVTNQTNLLGVPLLVKGPEFAAGAIVDDPVQSVDIVPTVARLAGIEIPWSVDGVSLGEPPTVARTRHPVGATKYLDYNLIEADVRDRKRHV